MPVSTFIATVLAVGTLSALFACCHAQGGPTEATDRDVLLQLRDSIENWDAFQNASNLAGWTEGVPVCTWGGVVCSDQYRVTQLMLGCGLCTVRAAGALPASLASLDRLQVLHLDSNWLNGTLPREFAFGFPNLVELRLDYNSLSGDIPPEWGAKGAFPKLQKAHLGGNQLRGVLPPMHEGAMPVLEVLGLQWNTLHGAIPTSWTLLRALRALWLRPGNYQLCGSLPPNAPFSVCREVDTACEVIKQLGSVCSLEVPIRRDMLPPPTIRATMLEAVLRIEGANVLPFTANSLNIFVTAVVSSLPNVTANDIIIGPVGPVVLLSGNGSSGVSGRQLATPSVQPYPGLGLFPAPTQQQQAAAAPQAPGSQLQVQPVIAGASGEDSFLIEGGGRRLLAGGRRLQQGLPSMSEGRRHRGLPLPPAGQVLPALLGAAPPGPAGLPNLAMGGPVVAPGPVPQGEPLVTGTAEHPYGTPVPNLGLLIGADISMQLKLGANNLSAAEELVADMAASPSFTERLRTGGLAVAHVLLVSCEPLDPGKLPVGLRPSPLNISIPPAGITVAQPQPQQSIPAQQPVHTQHSFPVLIGSILAFVGLVLAGFGIGMLIWQHRKKKLHPSGSPTSALSGALSTEALRPPGGALDTRRSSSIVNTSSGLSPSLYVGTPDRQLSQGDPGGAGGGLRGLRSGGDSSGGAMAGLLREGPEAGGRLGEQRSMSSDTGTLSDASRVARLGGGNLTAAQQQLQERQAAGAHASTSGQDEAGWGDRGVGGQVLGSMRGPSASGSGQIELPSMPWSDWEVPAEQITICKREDGSDWELGSGAFGKVFKALRGGVQVVAVKVLKDEEVGGVASFIREIAILKGCRHTNIVQFQGACVEGGRTMLVMEYVEGGDLWRNLASVVPTRVQVWRQAGHRVALDVARGLCFLHARSVALFDLHSRNVLLTRDGTAKIADVGLAKVLTQGYVSTHGEGTLAYAAPELLWGERCSEKVDIYSFGVLLWELATAERPMRGQRRDVRVPEEVPEEVAELMNACLQLDPKQRPSAKQAYEALVASAAALAARAASGLPPASAQAQRRDALPRYSDAGDHERAGGGGERSAAEAGGGIGGALHGGAGGRTEEGSGDQEAATPYGRGRGSADLQGDPQPPKAPTPLGRASLSIQSPFAN